MIRSRWLASMLLIWVSSLLFNPVVTACQDDNALGDRLEDISTEELISTEPTSILTESGLPRRVLICRSAVCVFAHPSHGAERVGDLRLYDTVYVSEVDESKDFLRVARNPWAKSDIGWIPSQFCQDWPHNEALLLSAKALTGGKVDKLYFWPTPEAAREHELEKAIYAEPLDVSEPGFDVAFCPLLRKDPADNVYEIAFPFATDNGLYDEWGQPLPADQLASIAARAADLNLLFVIENTLPMDRFFTHFRQTLLEVIDSLKPNGFLSQSATGQRGLPAIRVRIGFRTYHEELSATSRSHPESVAVSHKGDDVVSQLQKTEPCATVEIVDAVKHAITDVSFQRGAMNWIILIGTTSPTSEQTTTLVDLLAEAKSRYVHFEFIACRSPSTSLTFQGIASTNYTRVHEASDPTDLMTQLSSILKRRVAGMLAENALLTDALKTRSTFRDAGKALELSEQQVRILHHYLMVRGADVVPYGLSSRTAWLPRQQTPEVQIRPHVRIDRWSFAARLSSMIDILDSLQKQKQLATNRHNLDLEIFSFAAGKGALTGLGSDPQTIGNRMASIPEPITALSLPIEQGDVRKQRLKCLNLLKLFQESSMIRSDHLFVPLDELP